MLTGNCTLAEAIQESPVANLHFLTSGPLPTNPGRLVESLRLRSLVTERLRLELTPGRGFDAHPGLTPDQANPGAYLLDLSALTTISAWLEEAVASGRVLDFRIGPPSLDDIYTAAVAVPASALQVAS